MALIAIKWETVTITITSRDRGRGPPADQDGLASKTAGSPVQGTPDEILLEGITRTIRMRIIEGTHADNPEITDKTGMMKAHTEGDCTDLITFHLFDSLRSHC